jgi:hypothetical protein
LLPVTTTPLRPSAGFAATASSETVELDWHAASVNVEAAANSNILMCVMLKSPSANA